MDHTNWKTLLPDHFSADSRVWVYQSSRPFNEAELKEINEQLYQFYSQWMSHNHPVKGWAAVLFNQFIVILSDDTSDRLCGSAVDHSIHVMKSLERQYQVSLLDRMLLGFKVEDKVELLPMNQVSYALENGIINGDTLFFNNAITTKSALEDDWLIKVKDSWLGKRFLSRIPS